MSAPIFDLGEITHGLGVGFGLIWLVGMMGDG